MRIISHEHSSQNGISSLQNEKTQQIYLLCTIPALFSETHSEPEHVDHVFHDLESFLWIKSLVNLIQMQQMITQTLKVISQLFKSHPKQNQLFTAECPSCFLHSMKVNRDHICTFSVYSNCSVLHTIMLWLQKIWNISYETFMVIFFFFFLLFRAWHPLVTIRVVLISLRYCFSFY